MDKQREEFEDAWVEDNSSTPEEAGIRREALRQIWHVNENGEGAYFDSFVMLAWKWWQASRAAIAVELPEKDDLSLAGDESTKFVINFRNSAIDECADAIRAAGLSIKEASQ